MFSSYSDNLKLAAEFGVGEKPVAVFLYAVVIDGYHTKAYYKINDEVFSRIYER